MSGTPPLPGPLALENKGPPMVDRGGGVFCWLVSRWYPANGLLYRTPWAAALAAELAMDAPAFTTAPAMGPTPGTAFNALLAVVATDDIPLLHVLLVSIKPPPTLAPPLPIWAPFNTGPGKVPSFIELRPPWKPCLTATP